MTNIKRVLLGTIVAGSVALIPAASASAATVTPAKKSSVSAAPTEWLRGTSPTEWLRGATPTEWLR